MDRLSKRVTVSLGAIIAITTLLPAGLGASEYMLCVHRDGHIAVEHYQKLCCKGGAAVDTDACKDGACGDCAGSTECQDDQCQDYPLSVTSDQKAPDAPEPVIEVGAISIIPLVGDIEIPGVEPLVETQFHSDFLGPPGARRESLLRTVILRL